MKFILSSFALVFLLGCVTSSEFEGYDFRYDLPSLDDLKKNKELAESLPPEKRVIDTINEKLGGEFGEVLSYNSVKNPSNLLKEDNKYTTINFLIPTNSSDCPLGSNYDPSFAYCIINLLRIPVNFSGKLLYSETNGPIFIDDILRGWVIIDLKHETNSLNYKLFVDKSNCALNPCESDDATYAIYGTDELKRDDTKWTFLIKGIYSDDSDDSVFNLSFNKNVRYLLISRGASWNTVADPAFYWIKSNKVENVKIIEDNNFNFVESSDSSDNYDTNVEFSSTVSSFNVKNPSKLLEEGGVSVFDFSKPRGDFDCPPGAITQDSLFCYPLNLNPNPNHLRLYREKKEFSSWALLDFKTNKYTDDIYYEVRIGEKSSSKNSDLNNDSTDDVLAHYLIFGTTELKGYETEWIPILDAGLSGKIGSNNARAEVLGFNMRYLLISNSPGINSKGYLFSDSNLIVNTVRRRIGTEGFKESYDKTNLFIKNVKTFKAGSKFHSDVIIIYNDFKPKGIVNVNVSTYSGKYRLFNSYSYTETSKVGYSSGYLFELDGCDSSGEVVTELIVNDDVIDSFITKCDFDS